MDERGQTPERARLGAEMSSQILTFVVCTALELALLGAYCFPALLLGFIGRWDLDNSETGVFTALFYTKYTCAVPVLVTLADRR